MFFELKNAKEVKREGFTAFLYNNKKEIPEYNSVYLEVHGTHDKEFVKASHRLYFVIEGEGVFNVGKETKNVKKNDVIVVPPQAIYSYQGKMKLFEVNFPATDSSDAVKLD